jgi:DNA primase
MTNKKFLTMEIPEIKEHLGILTVLRHYGLKPDKHDFILCPFHDDKEPSLKIYPLTNTFYCFSCGATGDQIQFIEMYEKITKHQAIEKAKTLIDPLYSINQKPMEQAQEKETLPRLAVLGKVAQDSKASFKKVDKAQEYLKRRGLNPEKMEVGYISTDFGKGWNKALQESGLQIGILQKSRQDTIVPKFKSCVLFFTRNEKGQIIDLYGRSIINNDSAKHYYLNGHHQGIYPKYPEPGTKKLVMTEAIIDCETLLQQKELTSHYSFMTLFGTNGFTAEIQEAVKQLQELEEVILFFDGDKAGQAAITRVSEKLQEIKPGIIITTVETPENEDVNSLLQGHDPEILQHLIKERKPVSNKKENMPEPLRTTGKLNTRNPEYITYTTDELQISILGGINLQQLDRLRITIKMSRTDTGDPLHSIRHTLDLYHSDYLEKFISKASEQLETGTNTIRRAIAELTEQIEQYRLSKIESLKEQKPQQRQLSEERKNRAIRYLKAPRLMERTNSDIGKTGMVGEENNRVLMYLVFTSRLREQPLHVISLGSSGTGKTYLQEKISELIPDQDKLEITILSENAFYYFDRKELKHKLVLIEDMDGAQDVLYPLRELQSKKRISKTIPIKDNKGNLHTITLQVEGPICMAGTTTRERLFEDNSNRSLLIYIDNSHEHKEQIMEYQRKLSAGKVNAREENELKEFFKDMQSVLKPIRVINPYAELLKLPEYVFKPLRTNSHYLATIETITFYHQYQREIRTTNEHGEPVEPYIETTLEDIEWANRLLKDVLLAKADELPRATREFFERLKNWMQAGKSEVFYAKEIRETFRMASSSCNRYILELLRNNYIKVTGGNKYRQGFEYQIIKQDEYKKLQEHVKTALDEALDNIKKSVSRIPTVSHNRNGILKENTINVLTAVSQ